MFLCFLFSFSRFFVKQNFIMMSMPCDCELKFYGQYSYFRHFFQKLLVSYKGHGQSKFHALAVDCELGFVCRLPSAVNIGSKGQDM